MKLSDIDIRSLIPQREPFVAVGELCRYDGASATTRTAVKAGGFFVADGTLSAAGMIENVAQTCAAKLGYYHKYILKEDIRAGVIGAVRNFRILDRAPVGSVIETDIEVKEEIFGITLIEGRIRLGARVIAEGQMKISIDKPQTQT